jgi:Family of unknown function (DUF6069)
VNQSPDGPAGGFRARSVVVMAASPDVTQRVLAWARIDFSPAHRQPKWWRVALATVLAITLSLAADAALVAIGTRLFPATKGYVHFAFGDYGKLTVIGVVVACAGWPVVTRISSAPRWLFFRLAILVTLVSFAPDAYIWHQGQPAHAVGVLIAMHLAIALITYNLLVHLAPVHPGGAAHAPSDPDGSAQKSAPPTSGRDGVHLR